MGLRIIYLTFSLFLFYNGLVNAQLHCINYTSENGLPEENINCATEDQNGYLWFGGQTGIYRFDGIEFINYGELGTGQRPHNHQIRALAIDNRNNVWASSYDHGIFKYSPLSDHWTNYSSIGSKNGSIKFQEINAVLTTPDAIWFGAKNIGLGKIDLIKDTIVNYSFDHLPDISSWKNLVRDMKFHPLDSNLIYLAAQGNVIVFDIEKKSFANLAPIDPVKIFGADFQFAPSTTVITEKGRVFISGWSGGIIEYDSKAKEYINRNPPGWKSENIWRARIFSSDAKHLWVTFRLKGIGKYDLEKNKWTIYEAEAFNRSGLLKGEYNATYESKKKETWVMTSKGISHIIPAFQSFTYYEGEKTDANYFLDIVYEKSTENYITSFSGNYAPVKVFDSNFILKDSFFISQNNWQAAHDLIVNGDDVYCTPDRLLRYNEKDTKLKHVLIPGFEKFKGSHQLVFESADWLWVLLGNHHLLHFNIKTRESQSFEIPQHQGIGREQIIYGGIALIDNQLWIPALSELIIFNIDKSTFTHYELTEGRFKELISESIGKGPINAIQQVLPIKNGKCWVITNTKGIYLVDQNPADQLITIEKKINLREIPAFVDITEMITGTDEDYWVATNSGLIHLEKDLTAFSKYGQREGLYDLTLAQGLTRIEDQLFIGMTKGFAKCDLNTLLMTENQTQLFVDFAYLDSIDLLGNSGDVFSHSQNDFHCKISTPFFSNPQQLIYAHRLLGLSDDWIETKADQRQFWYEELPPGSFTFEVKAKVGVGDWGAIHELSFEINPPWWTTWWFRLLSFVAILGLGYLLYRNRLQKQIHQANIEKKIATLENQSLRAQMNPHFVFNALNSIKSLILLDRKEEGINYLTQFSRMVREILAISKETFIPLDRELELLDLYLQMESLRFVEKFDFKFQIDSKVNTSEEYIPPLLMQPYVENAIWHGLLHKEGPAHLSIKVGREEEFIIIEIEDNGIGRELAAQSKSAFNKYKTESRGTAINQDRINLLGLGAEVEIIDLKHKGQAIGTKVLIKIPSNHDRKN